MIGVSICESGAREQKLVNIAIPYSGFGRKFLVKEAVSLLLLIPFLFLEESSYCVCEVSIGRGN